MEREANKKTRPEVRTGLGFGQVPRGALTAPSHARQLTKTRRAVVMDVMVVGGA